MAENDKTQDKPPTTPPANENQQGDGQPKQAEGKAQKVQYTKPTSVRDLEERYGDDSVPVFRESVDPDPVDENGFVGVSPEYANFANDTDKPLDAEGGAQSKAEKAFLKSYDEPKLTNDQTKENYDAVTHGAQSTGANK